MSEFALPDVGEGLTEAEIVTWHVAEGDVVTVNQVLVDIETAKSVVELPSPFAGTVTALLVPEGTTVPVGTPIVAIGDPAEVSAPTSGAPDAAAPSAAGAQERQPVLVGYGPRSGATTRRRRRSAPPTPEVVARPEPVPAATEPVPAPAGRATPVGARVLAKPPVRKLAKDHGIDLSTVPAEGPVVTRADVEAAIASLREPLPVAADDETRLPVKGVRRATAQAMVASAFTAPHVTEWVTLDVSATMELVDRLRADRRFAEVKVSPTLLVAKAVLLAMRRTPELNATWDEAAQEIVVKHRVNLGVAAATDRGLVVPNIRAADTMDLLGLAEALGELTATARAGRTQPAQMSGGTFTITNIGVFGIDAGTPILNPGETGILAVGQIDRRPWVVGSGADERVVPRWVTTLALSFDHRVVDGEQGSRFLADVAAVLRDPATALLY